MKIFRLIGILSVVLMVISAFLPWVHTDAENITNATSTGLHAGPDGLWKPALIAIIFSFLYIITLFIHKVWVKMAGVFFGVIVIAWSVSVYYRLKGNSLVPQELQTGIYLFLIAALGVMVAALFPYVPGKYRKP